MGRRATTAPWPEYSLKGRGSAYAAAVTGPAAPSIRTNGLLANEDEIRALFQDTNSEFSTLAKKLAGLGVLAAVKVGKDGAWIAHEEQLHRIEPVAVADVVDTNGAGLCIRIKEIASGHGYNPVTRFQKDLPLF